MQGCALDDRLLIDFRLPAALRMDSNSTLVLLLEKRALLNSVFDYETSDSYYTNLFALSALLLVSLALVVFVRSFCTVITRADS